MKISELISFLDKTRNKYGNLEVLRDIPDSQNNFYSVIFDKESMFVDNLTLTLHIE